MSIYNRSYMRGNPTPFQPSPWAVKSILITLVAVFLLQNILRHWLGSQFLELNFALNLQRLSEGWIHALLTYGFLHSTEGALPWHLVFNGLMLYWFGREIEARLGSERLLEFFILCILSGGIVWSCTHFLTGQAASVLGASSGVFGILYLFCRFRWNMSMEFMFLPLRFTGQQLFWVLFGFQMFFLLFAEIPGTGATATAYSAHLGGILGAFLYERHLIFRPSLISFFRRNAAPEIQKPRWEKRAAAVKARTGDSFKVNLSNRGDLRHEVDRILDKINDKGFGALSEEEKRLLDKAKDML
ncbi:MAG TPA: rhomboid family intramembrane serine protease [Oceanipulchritudo sp.]|nr:rhomboid family intramembrane serine protease [Oceanipulchritudo sp.]